MPVSPAVEADQKTSDKQVHNDTTKQAKKKRSRGFFAWARRGRKPVEVQPTRRTPDGQAVDDQGQLTQLEPLPAEENQRVTLQQLKQGYNEVLETMKSVRSHMDETTQCNRQLLAVVETLPDLLREIPEASRAQSATLELINQQLSDQGRTAGELSDAIRGLTEAAGTQGRALDGIHEHLADEEASRERLSETLGAVAQSNTATRESVEGIVEQARANDHRMRELYQRGQRMHTAVMSVCLLLAIGALALGGYVAWMLSQMAG